MKEKDFNLMLNNKKDMPKIIDIEDETFVKRYGGRKMVVAPPLEYDGLMKMIPKGSLITSKELRNKIALKYKVNFTCPLTAGIFINIVAWASYQRENHDTPYWRTLRPNGELNPKYPGGIEAHKKMLEEEGFTIICRGTKNPRYFVEDYEKALYSLL